MDYHIRRASAIDLDRLVDLEQKTFAVPWTRAQIASEISEPERSYYLIAALSSAEDAPLLGSISWRQVLDEADILNVAVDPSVQRQGIGRALLSAALSYMAERGVEKVTLEVAKKKTGAKALYLLAGFAVRGEIKDYYPEEDDDAWLMVLAIDERQI